MILLPLQLLISLFIGLFCLAVLGISIYLLVRSARSTPSRFIVERRSDSMPPEQETYATIEAPENQRRKITAITAALCLLLLLLFGHIPLSLLHPSGPDEPQDSYGSEVKHLTGPNGSDLAWEEFGPADAPRIILTHGWGLDSREWYYARKSLAGQFHVIVWDLPGLGQSPEYPDGNYSLEKLAADLHAVLAGTGNKPAVLVGHSIGGMINLTFCRLYPDELGKSVLGIAELDTTYTNPVKTTKNSSTSEALQKPVFEPLLHLMVLLSPAVRAANWLSYESGLAHMQNASSSFAGAETYGQLDFISKYNYRSSPAVVAKGTLAMLHWDASQTLPQIHIPVMIVTGAQDKTTLPSASDAMQKAIPGATEIPVSPAAHMGPVEQHQRYDDLVRDFATKVFGNAQARPL